MPDMTVLIAPLGVADGVKDVLKDLSAGRLVDPFVWISGPDAEQSPMRAIRVELGREYDTTLQDVVSSQRIDTLRLAVLVPLLGNSTVIDVDVERRVAELLASTSGGASMVRIRLLVARPGRDSSVNAAIALDGWHNVLIAPEDARGPGMGHVALGPTSDPIDVGRFAAPVVAALTGLWTDVDHAPLDETAVLPGHLVRLARSFYRRLDTTTAEASLRAQILAQDGGLPLPREHGAPVSYINDVSLATNSMASDLWRKHAAVLKGPRMAYPANETKTVGFWTALKMFFSFLGPALRNAPGAWYARMVNSASTGMASAVHSAVFGSDQSAYNVVVNGRTSSGARAGYAEIGSASGALRAALEVSGEERDHSARVDLSDLWQDYGRGALTLSDGGARSSELAPVQVGASRGVLRRAADAIPGPADRFDRIPGIIAATVEVQSVDATDVLGIQHLQAKLQELDQDPNLGLEARRTSMALEQWQRLRGESYGVHVGRILARQFGDTSGEVQGLIRKLQNAQAAPEPTSGMGTRLARWMQLLTIVLVVVIAASIAAVATSVMSWIVGSLIVVVAIIVWGVTLVSMFMRDQRDLFQQLNKRKTLVAEADVDRANLRTGLRDLDRMAGAYSQYLSWSRALGAFLAEPLGPDTAQHVHDGRIEWGLPRSTAIGYANPPADQLETTADYLRQDLFGLGWLTSPWEGLLHSAGSHLGVEGRDVTADPGLLLSDSGNSSGSPLDRWSGDFFEGRVRSTGADLMWDKALANLMGPKSELVRSLIGHVSVDIDGHTSEVTIDDFMAGVDNERSGRVDHFDRGMVTDLAMTEGRTAVKDDMRCRSWVGIGTVSVATQLSDGLSVDQLAMVTGGVEQASTSAATPTDWEVPEFPSPRHRTGEEPAPKPIPVELNPEVPGADEGFRF